MYIFDNLRQLLWSNPGIVYTHPPKTGGTSVEAALQQLPGHFRISDVLVTKVQENDQAMSRHKDLLERLEGVVSDGKPWVLSTGHTSFGDGWFWDLPPQATILMTYRPTRDRFASWIRYYTKMLEWARNARFEVLEDGQLTHHNDRDRYPGFIPGISWEGEHTWRGHLERSHQFMSLISLKLNRAANERQMIENLDGVLSLMVHHEPFLYRDLYPLNFLRSGAFRRRTIVIPTKGIDQFFQSNFGIAVPRLNTSGDSDGLRLIDPSTPDVQRLIAKNSQKDRLHEWVLRRQVERGVRSV